MDYKVSKLKHNKGLKSEYYIAVVVTKGLKLHITYDCKNQNLIIHEWYKLTKDELTILTKDLMQYFKVKRND